MKTHYKKAGHKAGHESRFWSTGHRLRAVVVAGETVLVEIDVVDRGIVEVILEQPTSSMRAMLSALAAVHGFAAAVNAEQGLASVAWGSCGESGAHGVDQTAPVAPASLRRPLAVVDVFPEKGRVVPGACQPISHGIVHVATSSAERGDGRDIAVHPVAVVVWKLGQQQR